MKRMYHQEWMPSIFGDFFDTNWMGRAKATAPAINVIEKKDEYKVQVAAPGMTKDDFKININEYNELAISLDKKNEKEDKSDKKNEAWLRREFSYTSYSQSFAIPEDVEMSKITAKIENGVLDINLPKKEVTKETPVTRQIEIQ